MMKTQLTPYFLVMLCTFIAINLQAKTVNVATEAQLRAAITKSQAQDATYGTDNGDIINITANITLTSNLSTAFAPITKSIAITGPVDVQGKPTVTINGSNKRYGIFCNATGTTCTFENLIVSNASTSGIVIRGSASLNNITVSGNNSYGIWVYNSAFATISNVTVTGNTHSGIWVEGSASATISNVTVAGNGASGISIDGNATLSNVTTSGNARNGINVWGSGKADVYNSIAYGNSTSSGSYCDLRNDGTGTLRVYNTVYGTKYGTITIDATCATTNPLLKAYNAADTEIATPSTQAGWAAVAYLKPTEAAVMQTADKAKMTVANLTKVNNVELSAYITGMVNQTYVYNVTNYDQHGTARIFGTGANAGKYAPGSIQAAAVIDLVVRNTANAGAGSLRQAIADATNGDTITFDPTVFPTTTPKTITLTSDLSTNLARIRKSITITGPVDAQGKPTVTIDGNNQQYETFITAVNTTCTFENLIVSNAKSIGIYVGGSATLSNVTVAGNSQHGICVDLGSATLSNVTVAGNGSYGISVYGSATLSNVTAAGNSQHGIAVYGSATLSNVTAAGNGSTGIYVHNNGKTDVYNSIAYDNGDGVAYRDLSTYGTGTLKVYNTVYGTKIGTITIDATCATTNPQLKAYSAAGTEIATPTTQAGWAAVAYLKPTEAAVMQTADKANMTIGNLTKVNNVALPAYITDIVNQTYVDKVTNYDQRGTARIFGTGANAGKYAPGSIQAGSATQYTITATAGANGSITPSGTVMVQEGGSREFTFTPNAGYKIAQVLVDGVNNTTAVTSGSYTFTNVLGNHTITANFTAIIISVTGISIKQSTSILVTQTEQLTANIMPANATNKNVTWVSSNTAIATVDNSGLVTAVAEGIAYIVATTTDGGFKDSCKVTVSATAIAVTGVSLNKTTLSLALGNTERLTATIAPATATNQNITWTSNNTATATVDNSGLVTAVGTGTGTATITATTEDGGYTAACAVTVTVPPVAVTGISLNKTTLSFALDKGKRLTATITPATATNQNITWTSSNQDIATIVMNTEQLTATIMPANATNKNITWASSNTAVATVDNNGLVTAVSVGTATITVTTEDGGYTATCAVTVNAVPPVAVTGISLNKTTLSLAPGYAERLTATIAPATATNQNITWASSNTAVATVDATGLVTAVSKGAATITVTTEDGGYTATCAVTVNAVPPVPTGAVTSISVKQSTSILVANTERLTANIMPANATNKNITWVSSNTAIATVDNSGLVAAVAEGIAYIVATTTDGGFKDSCKVTVSATAIAVTGVSLNKTTLSLAPGNTERLTATIAPATATNQNITWTSSNTAVATVDNSGLVTAVSAGTATITITTKDGGYTATCAVTVNAVPPVAVTGISLNKTTLSLAPGYAERLTATIAPATATNQNITWASSNTAVATVDATGLVTAVSTGAATITATTVNGNHTAICEVTVSTTGIVFAEGEKPSLTIYPNPTDGVLKVENGKLKVEKTEVFDIAGNLVFTTTQNPFNIGHLPQGIYIVKILTDKGTVTQKVVKQ